MAEGLNVSTVIPPFASSSSFSRIPDPGPPEAQHLAFPFSTPDYFCLSTNPFPNQQQYRQQQRSSYHHSKANNKGEVEERTGGEEEEEEGTETRPYGLVSFKQKRPEKKGATVAQKQKSARGLRWWREATPFSVPVRYPELLSNDPNVFHSLTTRACSDRGVRYIDAPPRDGLARDGVINVDAERGLTGVSLVKHSQAYRMSRSDCYPGIVQKREVVRQRVLARGSDHTTSK